jgi:hypothetical protein
MITTEQAIAIKNHSVVFGLLKHDFDSIQWGYQYIAIKVGIDYDYLIKIIRIYGAELFKIRGQM